jgi:hypothetical protein
MKPAPATSVLAIASFGGSFSTSACASLRGFCRAALASRMARLLAKSPCAGSRVCSTSSSSSRAARGTSSSGNAVSAARNRASITFFTIGTVD